MNPITFDQLPGAVSLLHSRMDSIETILENLSGYKPPEPDELLTVEQCAEFLSISVQTVYGLIAKNELPVMKRSKRCYFLKSELLNYLKQGKKKSAAEIATSIEVYLQGKRKGGK